MRHLTDDEAAAMAAGDERETHASHLAACATCTAQVAACRATLRAVAAVDVPEPPPLFWAAFSARVGAAIDTPPARAWSVAPARTWAGLAAVLLLAAALVFLLPRDPGIETADSPVTEQAVPAPGTEPHADETAALWPENDEAWEVVRSVAADVDYEAVRDEGIAPRPGALERAALELDADERAELVRLIQAELKRIGAEGAS
jgi:hypothetical protein